MVLTLRTLNTNGDVPEECGLRDLHVSFKHVHPEDEDVLAFLRIVTDPANQPVFVHCREGEDRTGMMVAVYRMVVQDWPKDKAMAEMKRMGFNEIWEPIEDYLEDFDPAKMKRQLRSNTAD